MPAKKSSSSKSMDIQKPGSATPDSSARPILVSNRPILQDPMVVSDKKDVEDEKPTKQEGSSQSLAASTKTIQPPEESESEEEQPQETNDSEPASEETKETPTKHEQPEGEQQTDDSAKDAAVVDAVIATSNRGSEASEAQKLIEADAKRKQAVQVLVQEKKYMVPIGQVTRRKQNRNAVILLVFIVAAAGTYFAVAMRLIELPLEPLLDIARNLK